MKTTVAFLACVAGASAFAPALPTYTRAAAKRTVPVCAASGRSQILKPFDDRRALKVLLQCVYRAVPRPIPGKGRTPLHTVHDFGPGLCTWGRTDASVVHCDRTEHVCVFAVRCNKVLILHVPVSGAHTGRERSVFLYLASRGHGGAVLYVRPSLSYPRPLRERLFSSCHAVL